MIEVGAGDGANFAYYPDTVSHVQAVEPEPYLRARAVEQAQRVAAPVEVIDGLAERLPAGDQSVDAVVISLMLCSVADQAPVLEEALRVLRPEGQLRFYEHVAASCPGRLQTTQRIADATVWPWLFGGCHTGRDTAAAIAAAGFVIDEIDRFDFPPGQPSPAAPHILGRASRPVDEKVSA
ncbi:class I SAM-dependent methyltransferase [Kribbella sancticallisti]|uniref:Class I SAM-dependent methyltransferase n=1 Tax=Kribbella sancticallisti TaxID=460087 RepID=A0ABN2CJH4_9ACTN